MVLHSTRRRKTCRADNMLQHSHPGGASPARQTCAPLGSGRRIAPAARQPPRARCRPPPHAPPLPPAAPQARRCARWRSAATGGSQHWMWGEGSGGARAARGLAPRRAAAWQRQQRRQAAAALPFAAQSEAWARCRIVGGTPCVNDEASKEEHGTWQLGTGATRRNVAQRCPAMRAHVPITSHERR